MGIKIDDIRPISRCSAANDIKIFHDYISKINMKSRVSCRSSDLSVSFFAATVKKTYLQLQTSIPCSGRSRRATCLRQLNFLFALTVMLKLLFIL